MASTSITRPANTTAYTAGDVIADNTTADIVFNFNAKGIYLMSAILRVNDASVASGMSGFKLHFYNAATAVPLADNAPITQLTADASKYLGYIDINAPSDLGDYIYSRTENINIPIPIISNKTYTRLETVGAYTPTSGAIYTISLIALGV